MKRSITVAGSLGLIMLLHAVGPAWMTATASADKKGKAKPRPAPATGGYRPVDKKELMGEFTCLATGGKRAQFQLAFNKDRFELKESGGPIPPEVLETVLGTGKKAKKIRGRWDLAAGKLTLTEIRADGTPGSMAVALRAFRTGPNSRWFTRINIGGTQYHLVPTEMTHGLVADGE
jgi:hypothetical protein